MRIFFPRAWFALCWEATRCPDHWIPIATHFLPAPYPPCGMTFWNVPFSDFLISHESIVFETGATWHMNAFNSAAPIAFPYWETIGGSWRNQAKTLQALSGNDFSLRKGARLLFIFYFCGLLFLFWSSQTPPLPPKFTIYGPFAGCKYILPSLQPPEAFKGRRKFSM